MAVMALLLGLVLPGLGATRNAELRSEARDLAGRLELARRQAVTTGRPHRVLIHLEEGAYRVEWFVSESDSLGAPPEPAPELDLRGDAPIPLAPPIESDVEYRPVPNRFGRDRWLGGELFFAGVETNDGWLEHGTVAVVFDRDGTADPAEIVIAHEDGREIALQVRPLLDVVRVRDAP